MYVYVYIHINTRMCARVFVRACVCLYVTFVVGAGFRGHGLPVYLDSLLFVGDSTRIDDGSLVPIIG